MKPTARPSSARCFSSSRSICAAPCLASQERKPGMGDSVAKVRRRGNSSVSVSATCLMSESPKLTPRSPVWVLLIE